MSNHLIRKTHKREWGDMPMNNPIIYQSGDAWLVSQTFEDEYDCYAVPFPSYDDAVSYVELMTKYC